MNFLCPMCQAKLHEQKGSVLDKNDGVTLLCPNWSCPAQEVTGHGNNAQKAFEIIQGKYKK